MMPSAVGDSSTALNEGFAGDPTSGVNQTDNGPF